VRKLTSRRELIGATATTALLWSFGGSAQERRRRVAVLLPSAPGDPEASAELAAFVKEMAKLGWSDSREMQLETRSSAGDPEEMAKFAKELVGLRPDVVVARSTATVKAVTRESETVPIVFLVVSDPIGEGFVASLARPGGQITGFTNVEASLGGKWLQLLKDVAPATVRVGLVYNPATAPSGGSYYIKIVTEAAPALNVRVVPIAAGSAADLERGIVAFADTGSALISLPDPFTLTHRAAITAAAARGRIPAVYAYRHIAMEGGLMSYGVDLPDLYRRAAGYVDRILRGDAPANLPVQAPTKYEFVINVKTSNALGLAIPPALLARADEVIE
jgi:ABC-type uncharacterized transport system substrate-binding protein